MVGGLIHKTFDGKQIHRSAQTHLGFSISGYFPRKRCTNRVTHIFGESAIRKDIMILKGEQNPKETIKMQIPYTTR